MAIIKTCCGCGGGGSSGGGGGASTVTYTSNAVQAQREVRPYAAEEESGGIDWGQLIKDALQWVGDQIMNLVQSENVNYIAMAANLSQVWIGMLPINVVEQEQISYEGKVTRYPIEDKNELADHMHNYPKKVVLKAWLGSPDPTAALAYIRGVPHLDLSRWPYWKILMIELAKLQRERRVVWYASGLQIIPHMVVTKFRPLLAAPYANAVIAEIVLEQVQFGTSEDLKDGDDVGDTGTPDDDGTQPPDEDEPEDDATQSFLGWIADQVVGWFTSLIGGGSSEEGGGEGGGE